jgi:hypothetical protein
MVYKKNIDPKLLPTKNSGFLSRNENRLSSTFTIKNLIGYDDVHIHFFFLFLF